MWIEPERKLFPSEVLWQSWVFEAKGRGSRSSGLKAIVRFCIINEGTQSVIWESIHRSNCTRTGDNHHVEYTAPDDGYYAILGTVNGASTMRMLLDHKAGMGYRTVERVIILGDEKLEALLAKEQRRSLLILLSARRDPPTRIH